MGTDSNAVDTPVELYSVASITERTDLSRTTINQEMATGRLRSLKVGTRRLIRSDDYHQWLIELESVVVDSDNEPGSSEVPPMRDSAEMARPVES